MGFHPPPSVSVPDIAVARRVDAQRLRGPLYAAICELSPSQAETLILHAIDDLTHKEIAALLDIKVGTVKSRLSRAKAQIRTCWDTETHGEIGPDGRPTVKPAEGWTPDGTQNGSDGNT
ncbi:MAG: RNA polymerase sigma factor [Actinobacteria bacterium]|nr:RNA polymerase sigma factor [Actinomycetota bacterium]